MTDVEFRPASAGDVELVKKTLYMALAWDPEDPIPPFEVVVSHPKIAVYHEGWMRPGDDGVVADQDGRFVGMAYCRLFADGGESQGFYDDQTPELAVGVEPGHRGGGIGRRLVTALHDRLAAGGVARMSLSVAAANPALRLYESLGYRVVERRDDDLLMVVDLLR